MATIDLAAMSTAIQDKLNIGPEMLDRLKSINVRDVADWTKEQWDRIPLDNLMAMDWSVLQKVPIDEVKTWSEVCICVIIPVACRLFFFPRPFSFTP